MGLLALGVWNAKRVGGKTQPKKEGNLGFRVLGFGKETCMLLEGPDGQQSVVNVRGRTECFGLYLEVYG